MNIPVRNRLFTVYTHTSPSGKVYVGITSNVKTRWRNGGYAYKTYNSIFKNAIEKYGWDNLKHDIILLNVLKSEADYAEKYLIRWYKLHNISYNITDGGEGKLGIHHSDETKKKMRDAAKGRKPSIQTIEASKKAMANLTEELRKKRFGHPGLLKGIPRSEETKSKISIAAKGRDMSAVIEAAKKARRLKSVPIVITKDGLFIGEFSLLSEACDLLGLNRSNANRALHHPGYKTKGYSINYKNIDNDNLGNV